MNLSYIIDFKLRNPRRNLPAHLSLKRGESNFVSAFSKAYINALSTQGVGGSEFAMSGFGIADFVWLDWRHSEATEGGTGLSVEQLRAEFARRKLTAFEMKLTDWRKGLAQAYRYSYFADVTVLVLPPSVAKNAKTEIKLFRHLQVGLWSFDKTTGVIRKLFTPARSKPRNVKAKEKALESIGRFIKFSEPTELSNSIS
jgi:hypothetical protein